MPEYLYRCGACSSTKTVFRHIYTDGGSDCPLCDGCQIPMQRDWSVAGVIFKGDGWGSK
jgi:putative FmdB family regulatory protein